MGKQIDSYLINKEGVVMSKYDAIWKYVSEGGKNIHEGTHG